MIRIGFDANPANADRKIDQIHPGSGSNFQHVSVDPCKQSLLLPRDAELIPSIEPGLNQGLSPLPATQPRAANPSARATLGNSCYQSFTHSSKKS